MKQEDIVTAIKCLQEKQEECDKLIKEFDNKCMEEIAKACLIENPYLIQYADPETDSMKYKYFKSYEDAKKFVDGSGIISAWWGKNVFIEARERAEKEREDSLKGIRDVKRSLKISEDILFSMLDNQHACLVTHWR